MLICLFPCYVRWCCTMFLDPPWEPRLLVRSTQVTPSLRWSLVDCTVLRSSRTVEIWPIMFQHLGAPVSEMKIHTSTFFWCSLNAKLFWLLFFPPAPQPPAHLSVKQGPSNDTIELLWAVPTKGDYSNFSLQWTPPDQLTVTQTHLTSCIVGGMFPGREYNFTLMTASGGGAKGGPTVRSQPIQRNIRTSRVNLKEEK